MSASVAPDSSTALNTGELLWLSPGVPPDLNHDVLPPWQKSCPGLRCPASAKAPRVKSQQTKVVHSRSPCNNEDHTNNVRSVSLPNEWGEKSREIPGCANQYHSFPAAGLKCQFNLVRLKTQVKPRKVINRYTFWYATGEASTTCRRLWQKTIRTSRIISRTSPGVLYPSVPQTLVSQLKIFKQPQTLVSQYKNDQ